MILLDTTVLVYAKGADHPLREPCRGLVAAIAEGKVEATTTIEVIQEFVHVRARRRDRSDAAALGRDYSELLSPLLSPTIDDLTTGLAIFERNRALGAFDAVLAACAARAEVRALVSADTAFAGLAEIAHVTPDRTGLSELLKS
ncbi:MAG TPA: type II toxin-antitoxin system VapC family toxin [Solirubrobacteraceae bacterium]|nr:type II toxin-antitoxin system VapC family toxin [Solirubrobacteraceae bacterium]